MKVVLIVFLGFPYLVYKLCKCKSKSMVVDHCNILAPHQHRISDTRISCSAPTEGRYLSEKTVDGEVESNDSADSQITASQSPIP